MNTYKKRSKRRVRWVQRISLVTHIGLHFCSFQREREKERKRGREREEERKRKRGREKEKERGRHHECQMSCKIIYTLTPPFSGGPWVRKTYTRTYVLIICPSSPKILTKGKYSHLLPPLLPLTLILLARKPSILNKDWNLTTFQTGSERAKFII